MSDDKRGEMLKTILQKILLYFLFCLVGFSLEWCYGAFWNVVGTTPWTYPGSPLRYTSFEGIPLWGVGGFIIISIYSAITQRSIKPLRSAVISVALGLLWIVLYSRL